MTVTPEAPRDEIQKMTLELAAVDRTIIVLGMGIDFMARQTCQVHEAGNVGDFLRYLRDLKSDLKERTKVLKKSLQITTAEVPPEQQKEQFPFDIKSDITNKKMEVIP